MTRAAQPSLFPADRRRRGRIRRGLDETLAELRRTDRTDPTQAAVLALCRVLADELDDAVGDSQESRFVRARVATTYQAALAALLEVTTGDAHGSEFDAMLSALLHPEDAEPAD